MRPVTMYNFFLDYIQLQTITQNINIRKKEHLMLSVEIKKNISTWKLYASSTIDCVYKIYAVNVFSSVLQFSATDI